jgi:hypothetical protein
MTNPTRWSAASLSGVLTLMPVPALAVFGDADSDGAVDLLDVAAFMRCFGPVDGASPCAIFDSQGDGKIDVADYLAVIQRFSGPFKPPCPEDVVVSPADGSNIPAAMFTAFGRVPPGATTVFVQGVEGFVQPDGTYYSPNVGLASGANTLRVDAFDASQNVTCSRLIDVVRTGNAGPLNLHLSPQSGPPGTQVLASVETPFAIQELRLDVTGDGVFDITIATTEATHVFEESGRFTVFAVAKTAEGCYLSNLLPTDGVYASIVVIGIPAQTTATANVHDPVDIAAGPNDELFVLGGDSVLSKFDASLDFLSAITLNGLTAPAGLAISNNGEIFVADSASHRVLEFLADGTPASDFGSQGSVGWQGAGIGQFNTPKDVAVCQDGAVFVADTGNGRLAKLSRTGSWLGHVSLTPPPQSIAAGSDELYVVNGQDRVFVYNAALEPIDEVLFSGTSLYSISASSTLVATSSGGVHIRSRRGDYVAEFRGSNGEAPLGAVAVLDNNGSAIVLIHRTRNELDRIVIPLDPAGSSPLDVWDQFVSLLKLGSVGDARRLLTDEAQGRLGTLNDTVDQENALNWLRSYQDMKAFARTDAVAYYEAIFNGVVGPVYVAFERPGLTTKWKLARF